MKLITAILLIAVASATTVNIGHKRSAADTDTTTCDFVVTIAGTAIFGTAAAVGETHTNFLLGAEWADTKVALALLLSSNQTAAAGTVEGAGSVCKGSTVTQAADLDTAPAAKTALTDCTYSGTTTADAVVATFTAIDPAFLKEIWADSTALGWNDTTKAIAPTVVGTFLPETAATATLLTPVTVAAADTVTTTFTSLANPTARRNLEDTDTGCNALWTAYGVSSSFTTTAAISAAAVAAFF